MQLNLAQNALNVSHTVVNTVNALLSRCSSLVAWSFASQQCEFAHPDSVSTAAIPCWSSSQA